MAEYAKLIEALRICAGFVEDPSCAKCAYSLNTKCKSTMMQDAAAAIEELQAEVQKYHDAFGRLSKTAVELEQRIAELRGVKPQEVQDGQK